MQTRSEMDTMHTGMDQIGLAKSSPFGWLLIVAFIAALFLGGGKLVQASNLFSKLGGVGLWGLGTILSYTISNGGRFSQNSKS